MKGNEGPKRQKGMKAQKVKILKMKASSVLLNSSSLCSSIPSGRRHVAAPKSLYGTKGKRSKSPKQKAKSQMKARRPK